MKTPRHHATPFVLLILAACAVVAAGCGSESDPKPKKSSKSSASKESSDGKSALTGFKKDADAAGCTVEEVKEQEALHIQPGAERISEEPPVTGKHYGNWTRWGGYDELVADGYVLHNLEHGGVAAWYSQDISDELQDALVNDLPSDGDKWVIAPREGDHPESGGITAAAWNIFMDCPKSAIDELGTEGTLDLLRTWYETTNSQGSEAEKNLDAIVPYSEDEDTSKLTPSMPRPVKDTTLYQDG